MKIERFEDIEFWQLARDLCNQVHDLATASLTRNKIGAFIRYLGQHLDRKPGPKN